LHAFLTELWHYIEEQIEGSLSKKIPQQYQALVADMAIGAALDLTYYVTKPFTNKKYYQEMKGISDASGVDFKILRRIHMIGEVTKGHCSMFGAWGNATKDNHTIQLRSLDWDFDGPYRKYPMATVYHPSSKSDGNVWMNIGFVGWIGILSGVS
jgi:isopenicillin-N N-acyltransferase-like protein